MSSSHCRTCRTYVEVRTVNEESVVVQNGVTVTKSFSRDEFPVPAVTFEVQSTREEPVDLRIADAIPEGFGVEQIGFHPEYGSEHWTATGDGEVKFERTIEAEEEFTTVYGVRMEESDEPDMFLQKPTVAVNPTDTIEADDTVPEESSSVVRELARGERTSVPGLDEKEPADEKSDETVAEATAEPEASLAESGEPDEAERGGEAEETEEPLAELTDRTEEPVESADEESDEPVQESEVAGEEEEQVEEAEEEKAEEADEPVVEIGDEPESVAEYDEAIESEEPLVADAEDDIETESESEPEGATQTADSPTDQSMDPATDSESLVAAFAAEIEAGNVAEDDLAVIRDAVVDEPESERVRIEHLQSRVSDLEAYSDALEEFIDEKGTAQELLADVEAEIDTLGIEMEALEERADAAAEERDTMSEHLESLEDTVEAIAGVAERIERVRGDIDALDERVDGVEETTMELEAMESELDSVKADLEELSAWRDQLSDVF